MYLRGLEVSAQYISGTDKDHAKVSIPHVLLLLEEMCLGGTKGGKKKQCLLLCPILASTGLLYGSSEMSWKMGKG